MEEGGQVQLKTQNLQSASHLFDEKTKDPYVEIATGDQEFERRDIELGISDGIHVEIKSGLEIDEEIKVWNAIESDEEDSN